MDGAPLLGRIASLQLEERNVLRRAPEIEQERANALGELLRENAFLPAGMGEGPFHLSLSIRENRLIFAVRTEAEAGTQEITLPLGGFRTVVRDYFLICESYFEAVKTGDPYRMEAIDMGRRGIHNEGSEMLVKALKGKIAVDFETARRLFTLICVLHIR